MEKQHSEAPARLPGASGRNFGVDLVRALAIIGVVLVHVSTDAYRNPVGSFDWWGGIFWGGAFRRNVPLFLMCSGAILLQPERELTLKRLYLHNVLRLLVSLFVWSMVFKVYHLLSADALSGANLWQAVKEVLLFKQEWHLYFMQIMLLVYLFLPVTRIITASATKRQVEYVLFAWFLTGILYPTLKPFWPFNLLYGIPGQWLMNMSYAAIGYGLLGWYLRRWPLEKKWNRLLCIGGLAVLLGLTWLFSVRQGSTYSGFFEGMSVGPALLASGMFGLCCAAKEPGPKLRRLVSGISKGSLCIYIVHAFFLEWLPSVNAFPGIPTFVSVPVISLCNLLCCCVIYLVLSRIPVVRKWLV